MQFLKVKDISKTYDQTSVPALHPVNFAVNKGEIITILGESGSGKTTLLKLLAGLLEPNSGEIILANEPIKGPSHKLIPGYDSIQVVNQGFLLSPNMRVWENLKYNLLRTSKSFQEKRIQELIKLCKLEGLAERYPRELSGGQQQRVAIGRALANHPKLLLLDEPFSNLDVILKNQLIDVLTEIIQASGTTAIFVMHNPYDALSISDRIGVIKEGKVIQFDTPAAIYNQPQTPYVARLFGSPTILSSNQVNELPNSGVWPSNALVCIREHAIDCVKDATNTLEAEVIQLRFYGDHWKATLKVQGDLTFYANIPRDNSLQEGNQIKISIDWKKVHIFDQELQEISDFLK